MSASGGPSRNRQNNQRGGGEGEPKRIAAAQQLTDLGKQPRVWSARRPQVDQTRPRHRGPPRQTPSPSGTRRRDARADARGSDAPSAPATGLDGSIDPKRDGARDRIGRTRSRFGFGSKPRARYGNCRVGASPAHPEIPPSLSSFGGCLPFLDHVSLRLILFLRPERLLIAIRSFIWVQPQPSW